MTLFQRALAPLFLASVFASSSAFADGLLYGRITSAAGEPLAGVTVSAKPEGGTITTSVFTDAQGRYYFPALSEARYRVRAQAVGFAPALGLFALGEHLEQDFKLAPAQDFERQLTGDQVIASLPEATPEDYAAKRIFRNSCVGCHTPGFTLQHRFDQAGWTKVLELMKRINVFGNYLGPNAPVNQVIDHNEQRLAAYLARARGPGASSMKFRLRPRPSGEAARVVFKEYDLPIDPDLGLTNKYMLNDGSDWSLGAPSGIAGGYFAHDAWPDLDGNLWFTNNTPSRDLSIGRVDAKTGAVKLFKVASDTGYAANSHGMTRDPQGFIWFNIGTVRGHAGLGKLAPRTGKITTYVPPPEMAGVGGAPTVDYDGKGRIWVSTPRGVLRFDPVSEKFTEFKSVSQDTPQTRAATYGVAGDADGNGWWAQMAMDVIGHGDSATGKSSEIRVPPLADELRRVPAADRAFYDGVTGRGFNDPLPWSQGPRRMGADKAGHVVWICDYWSGNLLRINTESLQTRYIPLPDPVQQPYHALVDSHHDVWLNLMNSDQILRYDPPTGRWTAFDFPSHGTETRYVSILESGGKTELVVPYYRTMKLAVMTFRSPQELQALAAEIARPAK